MDSKKKHVAEAAIAYIKHADIIGVGTGSTVNYFVEALSTLRGHLQGAVASSEATAQLLKKHRIPVIELNNLSTLSVYVDGADEFNAHKYLIKGGGGALTREKIIAQMAEKFICIVDQSKKVDVLGRFPLPLEVIPMARSYLAREIVKLKGNPVYRQGVVTDNGNVILDVHGWHITDPIGLEKTLNNLPGVVTNGLFAQRHADIILVADDYDVKVIN